MRVWSLEMCPVGVVALPLARSFHRWGKNCAKRAFSVLRFGMGQTFRSVSFSSFCVLHHNSAPPTTHDYNQRPKTQDGERQCRAPQGSARAVAAAGQHYPFRPLPHAVVVLLLGKPGPPATLECPHCGLGRHGRGKTGQEAAGQGRTQGSGGSGAGTPRRRSGKRSWPTPRHCCWSSRTPSRPFARRSSTPTPCMCVRRNSICASGRGIFPCCT